jgi:hypothetical protein
LKGYIRHNILCKETLQLVAIELPNSMCKFEGLHHFWPLFWRFILETAFYTYYQNLKYKKSYCNFYYIKSCIELHYSQSKKMKITKTLKFTNILNAGTVHEGTPSSDFSIFDLLHAFFGSFFLQNWNLWPWFSLGALFRAVTQWEGGVWFLRGPTNHTIGARFFHSRLSRI